MRLQKLNKKQQECCVRHLWRIQTVANYFVVYNNKEDDEAAAAATAQTVTWIISHELIYKYSSYIHEGNTFSINT